MVWMRKRKRKRELDVAFFFFFSSEVRGNKKSCSCKFKKVGLLLELNDWVDCWMIKGMVGIYLSLEDGGGETDQTNQSKNSDTIAIAICSRPLTSLFPPR